MIALRTTVDDARLMDALRDLSKAAANPAPALRDIGEMLATSIDRNFEAQGRYHAPDSWRGGGNRWTPLADATVLAMIGGKRKGYTKRGALRAKAARRIEGKKILQDTARLRGSIWPSVENKTTLVIGTHAVAYAAIHQFGGTAGRGKKTTIPARPYLVIQDEDIDDAIDIIRKHLMRR